MRAAPLRGRVVDEEDTAVRVSGQACGVVHRVSDDDVFTVPDPTETSAEDLTGRHARRRHQPVAVGQLEQAQAASGRGGDVVRRRRRCAEAEDELVGRPAAVDLAQVAAMGGDDRQGLRDEVDEHPAIGTDGIGTPCIGPHRIGTDRHRPDTPRIDRRRTEPDEAGRHDPMLGRAGDSPYRDVVSGRAARAARGLCRVDLRRGALVGGDSPSAATPAVPRTALRAPRHRGLSHGCSGLGANGFCDGRSGDDVVPGRCSCGVGRAGFDPESVDLSVAESHAEGPAGERSASRSTAYRPVPAGVRARGDRGADGGDDPQDVGGGVFGALPAFRHRRPDEDGGERVAGQRDDRPVIALDGLRHLREARVKQGVQRLDISGSGGGGGLDQGGESDQVGMERDPDVDDPKRADLPVPPQTRHRRLVCTHRFSVSAGRRPQCSGSDSSLEPPTASPPG